MKYLTVIIILLSICSAYGQIQGTVIDHNSNKPISGAIVMLSNSGMRTLTDSLGIFKFITTGSADSLKVAVLGYQSFEDYVVAPYRGVIRLQRSTNIIEHVVVSTGYYQISKERSTGSFATVNEELFNRSTSPNVLDRLEGVVPGLLFDKRNVAPESSSSRTALRIRGESTLFSNNEPLIVLDNFPYEGDLSAINPDIIENVTVLRDAAAASIWGARAGNGVIVITTKKGRYNQDMRISWDSNIRLSGKPDLMDNPNFLPGSSYMEAEKYFFDQGLYGPLERNLNQPPLSPYIEYLIALREEEIDQNEFDMNIERLESTDIRREAGNYLYRTSIMHRHSITVRGGMQLYTYAFNVGYQDELQHVKHNGGNRFNINADNSFKIKPWLQFATSLSYSKNNSTNNGIGLVALNAFPYSRLKEDDGTSSPFFNTYRQRFIENPPAAIVRDWNYRPLDDIQFNTNVANLQEIRLHGEAQVTLLQNRLNLSIKYQYRDNMNTQHVTNDVESFYIRNLLNRFTQPNGVSSFPEGGQLRTTVNGIKEHNGRAQMNFNQTWKEEHEVFAIAGAEVRQHRGNRNISTLYAYDPEFLTTNSRIDYFTRFNVLPRGTALIPVPLNSLEESTDRFISYFSNMSYTFKQRYTLSSSIRTDASNLFGVKTNQKWVPLWSVGGLWHVHKERFFPSELLSKLTIKATYGHSGNVNDNVSAFITANYLTSGLTGLRYANIRTPGNPQMRWEKVTIKNLGIDFELPEKRVVGSVDFYVKNGTDLFGDVFLDPSNGIAANSLLRNHVNYASTRTKGFDIELQTINTTGKWTWISNMYVSYASDKVTNYDQSIPVSGTNYFSVRIPPKVGVSMNSLYTYPVLPLDPQTGDPLVTVDGELSTDYGRFYQATTLDDLVLHGSRVPKYSGAVRNSLSVRGFTVSANIIWKAGYYFLRSSIDYNRLFAKTHMHADFEDRWQKPGDEHSTSVPSQPDVLNVYRDEVYLNSASLVENGSHIRLKDINVSYKFQHGWVGAKEANLFFMANDLGIIYRKNKKGIDPDYRLNTFSYRIPPVYSLGVKLLF